MSRVLHITLLIHYITLYYLCKFYYKNNTNTYKNRPHNLCVCMHVWLSSMYLFIYMDIRIIYASNTQLMWYFQFNIPQIQPNLHKRELMVPQPFFWLKEISHWARCVSFLLRHVLLFFSKVLFLTWLTWYLEL